MVCGEGWRGIAEKGYPSSTRLKQIKQRTRKALRIESLLPDIQSGKLRFMKHLRALLEQFEMYPMHPHDDGPDAVQMAFLLPINVQDVKRELQGIQDIKKGGA